jgi:hypothetical protein
MRPRSYFLLAAASAAVVLIAAIAIPDTQGGCAQASDPAWFTPLVFAFGSLSIIAVFLSVIGYGRGEESMHGWRTVTWIVQATLAAGLWGAAGFIALFVILVPSGCLD